MGAQQDVLGGLRARTPERLGWMGPRERQGLRPPERRKMGSQLRETEQMLETVGGMACVSPEGGHLASGYRGSWVLKAEW